MASKDLTYRDCRWAEPGAIMTDGTLVMWICALCGGGAEDEQALLDHQEWCLADPEANTRLLSDVAERDGELTQEALVAAARKRRVAQVKKQI